MTPWIFASFGPETLGIQSSYKLAPELLRAGIRLAPQVRCEPIYRCVRKEKKTMRQKRSLALVGSLLVLMVAIACGPPANPPPPKWTFENPSASTTGARASSQEPSRTAAADTMRETGSRSSLDALRDQSQATTGPLRDIYFAFDRYDLQGSAQETLKANAEWLKANPAARVQIEGHCDDRGTVEYNLALGDRRAHTVREYLVTLGVGIDRLSVISYGEEIPVCKEQTENCWEKNRRARFVVLSDRST